MSAPPPSRASLRKQRLLELEHEQRMEDMEALKMTEEQRLLLFHSFRSVKFEWCDLDGMRPATTFVPHVAPTRRRVTSSSIRPPPARSLPPSPCEQASPFARCSALNPPPRYEACANVTHSDKVSARLASLGKDETIRGIPFPPASVPALAAQSHQPVARRPPPAYPGVKHVSPSTLRPRKQRSSVKALFVLGPPDEDESDDQDAWTDEDSDEEVFVYPGAGERDDGDWDEDDAELATPVATEPSWRFEDALDSPETPRASQYLVEKPRW
ncbi:unnamed protein product [Mycena citricolor]|uniref:Uncharacterized protein n=1 Tax=Mycena citricolor TaxID=2018698 RepID=A0AAD2HTC5_9AGAR|nr:unnamed protein product [Mycena citricolor]